MRHSEKRGFVVDVRHNRTLAASKACSVVLAAGAVALTCGCASHQPSPLPKGLSLTNSIIIPEPAAPTLIVSALPGGKAGGAGVGAGKGLGFGALGGAAACLAAGPFAPLCLIAVVPATTAIGAVAGGVVGGVTAETTEAVAFKAAELTKELGSSSNQTLFAQTLQGELNGPAALNTSLADAAATIAVTAPSSSNPVTVTAGIVEIGTEGKSEFALRFVTRAQVRRSGEASPVHEVFKEVQSEAELTISQWMAQDSFALRAVLKRCLGEASRDMAVMLTTTRLSAFPGYSTSCNDVEADWRAPATGEGLANRPLPQNFAAGDRWEWRQFDNRTKIEEGHYTRSVLSTGDPPLFSEFPGTADLSKVFVEGGYQSAQKPWRIWPLEVGKKWTFDGGWRRPDGATGRTRQDVEVVAYEEVIVPAGTFMAFKIEARGFYRNDAGGGARQNDTYWYAPAVYCDVKHVRQDDRNFYTRELVTYLRDRGAVKPASGSTP